MLSRRKERSQVNDPVLYYDASFQRTPYRLPDADGMSLTVSGYIVRYMRGRQILSWKSVKLVAASLSIFEQNKLPRQAVMMNNRKKLW